MIQKQDVESVFAEQLNKIQNKELRDKVVETFVLACQRGNWDSIDAIRKMPFTLLTETHGVDFIDHTIAVTEGAAALGKAQTENYAKVPYSINFDRLYAGGLLHDVGKLLEIQPDGSGGFHKSLSGKYARHPISGALLAAECGLDEDVINTIACHAKEGDGRPQVVETVLIHQADFATFNPLVMKQKGILIEA